MISKLAAFPHCMFAIILSLIFFTSCKSPVTTEIILEKPTTEQLKDLDNYLNILSQRAKNCGVKIATTSVNSDGNLHIICKGGDPVTIQKLLFKKNVEFNLMVALDESIIWEFLQNIDMSNVQFDTSEYHGSKYDSIASYLKIKIDNADLIPIFGFAYPADTNYITHILDSLLENKFGANYCRLAVGIPFLIDSLRLPLYILKIDEQNPFEKNEKFIDYSSVGSNEMTGRPEIEIKFKKNYMAGWAEMTGNHKGEVIALLIDHQVYSAPIVNEKIVNGRASIGGPFTNKQAEIISGIITSDQLPFELKIISVLSK